MPYFLVQDSAKYLDAHFPLSVLSYISGHILLNESVQENLYYPVLQEI